MGILEAARRNGGRSAELTRLRSRAIGTVTAASVAIVLALAIPTAANADPDVAPPAQGSIEAPAITSPVSGDFIGSSRAVVSGTKAAGSEVQILAGSSRTNVCTVRNDDTRFECDVSRLPSGASISLSAVQLSDDAPNVESAPVVVDILAAPTIAGSSPQLTSGLVQGGGYPSATIFLTIAGGSTWSVTAGSDGTWAYVLPRSIGSGTHSITATQSTSFSQGNRSEAGSARRILLDVDAPSAPRLTSPTVGSNIQPGGTVFSGTGEDRATVEVFAVTGSGADQALCTAVVSGRSWTCIGAALPPGTVTVTAFQKDAAGNVGAGSTPLELRVVAAPAASPSPTATPDGTEEPAPAPVAPAVPPTTPGPTSPAPVKPETEQPPQSNGWVNATPFTATIPSALGTSDLAWLRSLLLAAVAILLLLVPARMLATTVTGRQAPHRALSLTGRNREKTHDDPDPLVSTPGVLLTALGLIVAAGGIVLFANPVHGQPEYLRVFIASVVAIALLNLAATTVPKLLSPRLARSQARIDLSPRFLIAVTGVALLSRVLDLQPALVFGVVFAVIAVSGSRASRGILSLVRIGTVFTVGIVAWLASTVLGGPSGFADILLTEIVNITAMAGIGSAAILLVPLGKLDGRALLVWSRPAWFSAAVVVLTVLFALLAPVVDVWQNSGGVLIGMIGVLVFGAVGFSVWLWRRMIQPNLPSD